MSANKMRALLTATLFMAIIAPIKSDAGSGQNQFDAPMNVPLMTSAQSLSSTQLSSVELLEQQLAAKVNALRLDNGQMPLKLNLHLTQAARDHANGMGVRNFFGHQDPDNSCSTPSVRIVAAGYGAWTNSQENVGAGYATVDTAFAAFFNSPTHRAAILDPVMREFGVGYFFDASDQADVRFSTTGTCPYTQNNLGPFYHYWVINFASRLLPSSPHPALPAIAAGEAISVTSRKVEIFVHGGAYGLPTWATQTRFMVDVGGWSDWQAWKPKECVTFAAGGAKEISVEISNGTFSQIMTDTIEIVDDTNLPPGAGVTPCYILDKRIYIPVVAR
jgi:uncharacterized protein YkwD